MEDTWIPRDGDAFLTRDNFVFYTFGYEHPDTNVFAFLKYIPSNFSSLFPIEYLPTRWKLNSTELMRPEKLYSTANLRKMKQVFRTSFPAYLYFCHYRQKEMMCPALDSIRQIYVPDQQLKSLLNQKNGNHVRELAKELVIILSNASDVSIEDFGVHGSIALGAETSRSDVDITVYGARNFRRVEAAVRKLSQEGTLAYAPKDGLDKIRNQHARFNGKRFIYNAVRKVEEIRTQYGDIQYSAIAPVRSRCTVINDDEAMFRPAVYEINNYASLTDQSRLESHSQPCFVTSMIGAYRNVARKGDLIEVSGVLERVQNLKTGKDTFQVVVGSGTSDDEYILPCTGSRMK